MRKIKKYEFLVVGLLCLVYFGLAIIHYDIPVMNDDEALEAMGAWQIIETDQDIFYEWPKINISDKIRLPLMTDSYQSALPSYLLAPFFYLFGINVFSIRLSGIFLGLIIIILTYIFSRRLFSKEIALLSIFFLSTHPVFIVTTKLGIFFRVAVLIAVLGSLFCLIEWYRKNSRGYFYLGMLFLGLAMSLQIASVYFLGAIVLTGILFFKLAKSKIFKGRYSILIHFLGASFFVSLGLTFFYLYNFSTVSSGGDTIRFIYKYFPLSLGLVKSSSYLQNLYLRAMQLYGLLISDNPYLYSYLPNESSSTKNYLYLFLFFASLLWVLTRFFFDKDKYKRGIFLISLMGFALVISPFTVTTLQEFHLLFLLPLFFVIIGFGILDFISCIPPKRCFRYLGFSLLLLVLVFIKYKDLSILKQHYHFCDISAGPSSFNAQAMDGLINWLNKNKISGYYPLDYHISRNVFFLTKGKVKALTGLPPPGREDYPEYEPFESLWSKGTGNFFVGRTKEAATYGKILQRFIDFVEREDKDIVSIEKFYSKDKQPCFVVFKLN